MRILVHADPQPHVKEPMFVKEAYIGLILDVERAFLGHRAPDKWPNGLYMVCLADVLEAMREVSPLAYEWLRNEEQSADTYMREHGDPTGVQLPLSAECCTEVPERFH